MARIKNDMEEYPIKVGLPFDAKRVEIAVEQSSRDLGLVESMRGTLAKYPGCVHWHFKKPRVSGTLEVTSWPSANRLWITVQQGRRAEWLEEAAPAMERSLRTALGAQENRTIQLLERHESRD
jgi:hypothetical protein